MFNLRVNQIEKGGFIFFRVLNFIVACNKRDTHQQHTSTFLILANCNENSVINNFRILQMFSEKSPRPFNKSCVTF